MLDAERGKTHTRIHTYTHTQFIEETKHKDVTVFQKGAEPRHAHLESRSRSNGTVSLEQVT